jgi:hypothetical protein
MLAQMVEEESLYSTHNRVKADPACCKTASGKNPTSKIIIVADNERSSNRFIFEAE